MTQSKAKGELCEVFSVKGTWALTCYTIICFGRWHFFEKQTRFLVIGLSFHESSCVNVEEFSLIAILSTITVITVYNSPLNFLMHVGA